MERKLRRLPQILGVTLAVMLTLAVAQGLVFGPEAQADGRRGLEDTWLNEVKIWHPSASSTVRQSRQSAPQHGGAWYRTAGRAVQAGRGEGRWAAALRGVSEARRGGWYEPLGNIREWWEI